MRPAGARTLGQGEASRLIFGMPKATRDQNAVKAEFGLAHRVVAIAPRQSRSYDVRRRARRE